MPMVPGNPLMASIDSFWIMVLIAVGSAFVEWLQKRRQRSNQSPGEAPQEPPPSPLETPTPAAPGPGEAWQEELRRLLGGEQVQPKPAPPIPQILEPAPTPIPAPATHERPRPADIPPLVIPPRVLTPTVPTLVYEPEPELAPAPSAPLAHFTESAAAHQRASHIDDTFSDRLRHAPFQPSLPSKLPHAPLRPLRPDLEEVRTWLRQPRSARQAIVASIILGPPKSSEL